ncbi:cell division protein FtsQ/DivIB [Streptomyces sp. HMX112]|uniref:cell division protein FtsQ/DivIB n=1 Tax=Streptomyces sp. HMX112 TaxID=3390850 RepID=UPI003A80440C
MAGPTTADRGARTPKSAGRPSARPPSARPGPPGGRRLPGPRVVLPAAAVVVLAVAVLWVLYGSTWLRVQEVTVTGTRVLTPRQVEAVAAVPMGEPLVSADTGGIEERLRRRLPRIDSVAVVRSWPHTVELKVTERRPVLLIEKGAKFIEVDAKGVRFATVGRAPRGVPRLELTVDQSPSLRRFDADRLTVAAVGVAGDLPAPVAEDTRVVHVRSYDSITLELSGDRTVMWGSGEHGEAKARALTALMKAAPKGAHFDVSAPTAPAVSRS